MQFQITHRLTVRPGMSQTPSVARLANGELLVLFANLVDVLPGCRLFLTRSGDDGLTWSPPEDVVSSQLPLGGVEGTLSCIDEMVFVAYVDGSDLKRHPNNPVSFNIIRSTDGGKTFPTRTRLEGDWLRRCGGFSKIIRLRATGELLMPLYSARRCRVLASSDHGQTWHEVGQITEDPAVKGVNCSESALVELPDGRLLAILRGDSMDADAFPYGFRAVSNDAGRTWSAAQPTNINLCEPRPLLMPSGEILLTARSWPGNMYHYYRPIKPEERAPGSQQEVTTSIRLLDEYRSGVRQYGVTLFTSNDQGRNFQPQITMEDPQGLHFGQDDEPLRAFRYQAGYADIASLDDTRYFVVFRQPDPNLPQIEPGRTYSHVFQRYVAANIVQCVQ